MKEKRKFKRLDLNLPVGFRSLLDDATSFASTVNVSPGGLCILAKEKIPVGRRWPFKLEAPDGKQFSLQAEVIWNVEWPVLVVIEYKMGVKLQDAFSSSLAAYSQFYFKQLK